MLDFKSLKSLEVYLQSLIQSKLWVKIIIGVFVGVGVGILLGPTVGWVEPQVSVTIGNWLALPGKLFMKLVQMIMIPLIFASIITGIISASGEQLKKMGIGVGLYFVFTTFVSVTIGVVLAKFIEPGKYMQGSFVVENLESSESVTSKNIMNTLPDTISDLLPSNPLASMVSGEMLAIVLFTIIIGVAVVQLEERNRNPVIKMLSSIQEICMTIVKWAMRLVPFAVFGLMAQLTATVGLASIKGLGVYILTVLLGLLILIIFYLLIVQFFTDKSPWKFLKNIREAQLLAFSTASSAAVMPLSIKTAEDELGVDKSVSNFLIPIGATVNMDGTSLYQCISTLFIMQTYGVEINLANIMVIIFTIVAASIGTPAIPGGGVIILGSVLQGVGVPMDGVMLIVGIDRILGMFRTAVNVTGDLTACLIFNPKR